ncbi:hypothetical protein NKDENANG_02434 [Candidatus Entotheonellaceae bacterium PAL068K]
MQGELLLIEDLTAYPHRSAIEEKIIQKGIRNIVVAPIYYQDELIGVLELASPHPGDLHALNAMKLRQVLPLFSMAIKRSMDELGNRIQAIIKEQCTAIHPAVEWRFRQVALHWIDQRKQGVLAEMEPIVFDEVYPLYGVSDIRGSSRRRNAAIQADLTEHLHLAKQILETGYGCEPLPILAELAYHLGKRITQLESGLGAGDEIAIIDFLHRDVEPLFDHLQELCAEVDEPLQAYRRAVDPRLGTLYQQRKDFEESVMQMNETLSSYLDAEEEKAQAMFPHYFEKHKSDGVEFGIYVGKSLVEDGKFDMLYLHNLRLWQLMVMCGMARQAEHSNGSLRVPLEMAHLILVQHTPLSIRFRLDEKRFDIDGAYNMRYEIVKKRIDKATIRGTHERLTQPGKIAIVYSQPREAMEYHGYLAYLQDTGYLTGQIEDLELEDLEGAHGLKALRVGVDMQDQQPATEVASYNVTQKVLS